MSQSNDDTRNDHEEPTPQPLAEVNKSKKREHPHDPNLGEHGPIISETAAEPTDDSRH